MSHCVVFLRTPASWLAGGLHEQQGQRLLPVGRPPPHLRRHLCGRLGGSEDHREEEEQLGPTRLEAFSETLVVKYLAFQEHRTRPDV